jgi:hypothetical protein
MGKRLDHTIERRNTNEQHEEIFHFTNAREMQTKNKLFHACFKGSTVSFTKLSLFLTPNGGGFSKTIMSTFWFAWVAPCHE